MKLFKGGRILNELALSASPTTGYSDLFYVTDADAASVQLEVVEDSATFAVTTTLWASNKPNPNEATDDDWVDVSSLYTMPSISGAGNHFVALPDGGEAPLTAAVYRLKFVRTTGDGSLDGYLCIKDKV